MQETPQRVLVVVPHPNDSEFWCAGTIARWINEGAVVRYVVCTDGGKGTTDPAVRSWPPGGNVSRPRLRRNLGCTNWSHWDGLTEPLRTPTIYEGNSFDRFDRSGPMW